MRTDIVLVGLVGALTVVAASTSAADEPVLTRKTASAEGMTVTFNPEEKITLELKDAKLADVIRTLGQLAKMPVYVDPDVEGSVTLKVQDIPFQKVLAMLSQENGISIRIEKGVLIASRSSSSLLPALTLPEKFQALPRVAVEEYSKSFTGQPLDMRVHWNGADTCTLLKYSPSQTPTIILPLSSDSGKTVHVTQFGYDPVTRTRFLAVENSLVRYATALAPTRGFAVTKKTESDDLSVAVAPHKSGGDSCAEPLRQTPGRSEPVTLYIAIREAGPDGQVRSAPKVTILPGTTFTASSGLEDEASGQHRNLLLYGYVSRDGKSIVAALVATSIWVDPKDGRPYVFSQVSDMANHFFSLKPEGVLVGSLPPGVATDRPMEVSIALTPEGVRE